MNPPAAKAPDLVFFHISGSLIASKNSQPCHVILMAESGRDCLSIFDFVPFFRIA